MAITQKHIDVSDKYDSEQEYAENTPGVYMNMLGGIRWDPIDNKYKAAPIKYSDVDLTGEKIRFSGGQEFTVIFSCLATEYKNKAEVRNAWYEAAQKLKEDYIEQTKLEKHIASNNTDLKKLRKEGALLDQDDLEDK